MDAQFWINAWNEGRTGFHQQDYHPKLTKYFPSFNPSPGQKVLVPLCGKSKDLIWLHKQKLQVHGIELHKDAVEAFFPENNLPSPRREKDRVYSNYSIEEITISCGDFFELDQKDFYDFVYDRASLVALPAPMRIDYARVIKQSLKPGGFYLLIVYEYDQTKLEGPPFSVDENEIHRLYEKEFSIKLLESEKPVKDGPRLEALGDFKQKVYVLEKKR